MGMVIAGVLCAVIGVLLILAHMRRPDYFSDFDEGHLSFLARIVIKYEEKILFSTGLIILCGLLFIFIGVLSS